MTWMIGIDEAGYGPNLGPLVMTAVACKVPDHSAGSCLWKLLGEVVRRQSDPDDGRLIVDDSKLVYSTTTGLADLESAVWSILRPETSSILSRLEEYIESICPLCVDELGHEPWFTGQTSLPVAIESEAHRATAARFDQVCQDQSVSFGPILSAVICPPRFNQLLDHWDSKGAILGEGLKDLLQGQLRQIEDDEPIDFVIDKHGGRNSYFAMLQEAMSEGMVVAHEEGTNRSAYSVWGTMRSLRFTFQPRADGENLCVALASMASKYLRELLMLEFNRFWIGHLPDLEPTAGYPGDSARFFTKIKPVAKRLGISKEAIWRRK
jgi:ribonuclease HII